MRPATVTWFLAAICLGNVSLAALAQETRPIHETVPMEPVPVQEAASDASADRTEGAVEAAPAPARATSRADAPETIGEIIEPAPAPAPVPEGPKRIVVIGDNVAFGVARDIGEALSDIEDLTVERLAVGSSGLVRDDFHDWPASLEAILAEGAPTAVVLLVGANDRQPLRDAAGSHQPNSDAWLRIYERRAAEMAGIARDAGVPFYWVEMPIMKSGALTSTLTLTNAIFRKVTEGAGGTFVETWDQFAAEGGGYERVGPDLTGTRQRLRTGDGVHFTEAGYDVLAHVISRPLRQLPALQTDAARDQAEVEALMMGSAEIGAAAAGSPLDAAAAPAPDMPASANALPTGVPATAGGAARAPALPAGPDPRRALIGPSRPVAGASSPPAREVRIRQPFLLTRPVDGEDALVGPGPSLPAVRDTPSAPPPARADSTALPGY